MAVKVARSRERARVAGLTARRRPNDPELLSARRDYAAQRLADFIAETTAKAPALTAEQRDRLVALLSGGAVTLAVTSENGASA